MPQLVDVQNMCRWINHHGVEKLIAGIQSYIEEDFVRWESFDKIPRVASHTPIGVIELMPTSDSNEYAFKYVNGHPGNPALGLPTVMAFGVLAEVATGRPLLLAELTLTTALRTAAMSLVAARALARPISVPGVASAMRSISASVMARSPVFRSAVARTSVSARVSAVRPGSIV